MVAIETIQIPQGYRGRRSMEMTKSLRVHSLLSPIVVEEIGWQQILAIVVTPQEIPACEIFKPNVGWPPVWTGYSK